MIQILALREFYSDKAKKEIKAEVWFDRGMRSPSVEEIFLDPLKFIAKTTEPSERWNMYYTIAECLEERGRKLSSQHHIPFDIDKIRQDDELAPNFPHLELVAKTACEAIGVSFDQCGVLFSGNGIQIIVGINTPIESTDYFDEARPHYKAICDRINLRLMQAKLDGEADPSVWSPARLMRYPETENRKPGRPVRRSKILQKNIVRTDFDLKKASGLPDVPKADQISSAIADSFPTPDVKTIMDAEKGCKFLNWCQVNPEKVSETEWYAELSITARFPEGRKFSHQISKGHPKYSYEETEQKITQALDASGPRTCKNIYAVSGGKCVGCIHHNTKLLSPILIEGEGHVKTQKAGFYNFYTDPESGKIKKGKPDYEGLQKWFAKDYKYKAIIDVGTVWIWKENHYVEMPRDLVLKYAHDHFDPPPITAMRQEFYQFVRMNELVPIEWFSKSIEGKMNFLNGVLDVKSGVLTPHSLDQGFRSVLPCNYTVSADAPRWKQFIEEVTLGRQSLIDLLQEYMGYIFGNGSCKHEKILMLSGEGSNGKSTFVNVLRALATKEGFSSLSIKDMNNEQNRYLMEGKLVNIAEENSKDSFKDTELIKNFASGGYIRVKKVYQPPYEYINRTKLVMLCNTLPNNTDNTHGFYRKLLLIPFDLEVDESNKKDIDLLEKLKAELPGIINWVIEGYKRLEKQGKFSSSKEAESAMAKYQTDTDPLLAWAHDSIEYNPNYSEDINRQEIYDDYRSFCESNNLPQLSSNRVYKFLRSFVKKNKGRVNEKKCREGDKRYWSINHIRLLSKAKH